MINQIANATERTIRYLIPGIWIHLLLLATKDNNVLFVSDSKTETIPLLISVLFGIIAFIVYRLIFDLFEYAVINKSNIKKLKESFDRVKDSNENYSNYLYLKFAFVHMAFLLVGAGNYYYLFKIVYYNDPPMSG